MSKRTMLLMLSVIAALVVGWQVAAFAAAGISGNFESSDGNKPKQTHDDWDTITPIVNRNDTTPKDIDESFNDKEDTPQPKVVTGSIPGNKSDLTNFRIYQNKGTDDHDYLYMYWQRANILGTANMDFEFNQRQCTANFQTPETASTDADCANNGLAPQDSPNAGKVQFITPLRSEGDFLFTFDFASGGNQVNLNLLRWLTSADPDNTNADCEANGATLPCWGNKVALNGSGNADGAVNTAGNADTNPLFQKEGEAALDLTDTVFADKCVSFGSAYLKRRSSDSFTAAMKDFVPPAAANISNCGKVTIRKLTIPADQDQDFNYTSVLNREGTTGDNPAFKLNAKDTETDPDLKVPQNITFADVQVNASTNYSVTETLANFPAGWAFKSIDCTATNLDGAGGEPASELSKSGSTVTFQIDDASDVLDCTYTNEKPEGALLIKKQSTKTENPLVTNAGAVFSYDLNGGTGDPVEVTDDTTSAAPDEDADKGEVCVDGLTPGTYTVDEVSPPPGYGNTGTAADESVEVVGGTDCDVPAPPATDPIPGPTGNAVATFTNPPLGEITVQFRDLGSTETAASIVCHDSDPNTPALTPKDPSIAGDNDPGEDGDADPAFDDTNETFTNLPPGTYDCRVVVDP